jgi:dihydroorotase
VTCEVTPHHLVLSDCDLLFYDTNLKVNPPLRSARDRDALREGLLDGTIDAIATDHAPHARHEKEVEFVDAPFGMIGLETALPLLVEHLVKTDVLSPTQLIEKLTTGPAAALGISAGTLSVGAVADITVIDPAVSVTIDVNAFESCSRNTPFDGVRVSAAVTDVIVDGAWLLKDGEIEE